ncbi:putative methylthioribulose-1-phosphate dehydratase [Zancudomyces culisetae]|uniref:Putative methylthioribulose-1-phosphate dehydratase n=1 Tax=Zancudomyces culisetae TaxID=1213189 RepID=A0A1R1PDN3_ZANCU|nr:putative methylthioribulose-1-phosphate dehydratase [Zancudomyces culisetae]|eukprot:OMH79013.1 putative methylthioribulose-1-phosphate dehydratase [Zancudomyces culisetae]
MSKSTGEIIRAPAPPIKPSACTPLFFNAFNMRNAGACVHSHSQNAVLVTMMYGKEFVIKNQEMIKGIARDGKGVNWKYYDTLVVPIIENTAEEEDLKDSMAAAIEAYPETCAVLVRNHGVYVWGETWQKAKAMSEAYDYLFELAVKIRVYGLEK